MRDFASPYRTTEEVAAYLRQFKKDGQPNRIAALRFIERHIPPAKVRHAGRTVLVNIADVEDALTKQRP